MQNRPSRFDKDEAEENRVQEHRQLLAIAEEMRQRQSEVAMEKRVHTARGRIEEQRAQEQDIMKQLHQSKREHLERHKERCAAEAEKARQAVEERDKREAERVLEVKRSQLQRSRQKAIQQHQAVARRQQQHEEETSLRASTVDNFASRTEQRQQMQVKQRKDHLAEVAGTTRLPVTKKLTKLVRQEQARLKLAEGEQRHAEKLLNSLVDGEQRVSQLQLQKLIVSRTVALMKHDSQQNAAAIRQGMQEALAVRQSETDENRRKLEDRVNAQQRELQEPFKLSAAAHAMRREEVRASHQEIERRREALVEHQEKLWQDKVVQLQTTEAERKRVAADRKIQRHQNSEARGALKAAVDEMRRTNQWTVPEPLMASLQAVGTP